MYFSPPYPLLFTRRPRSSVLPLMRCWPRIISGWSAKYSLTSTGPSLVSTVLMAPSHAAWNFARSALLQENHVRHNARSCVALERGRWKADCPDQVCPIG